jgi:hypothetical protein
LGQLFELFDAKIFLQNLQKSSFSACRKFCCSSWCSFGPNEGFFLMYDNVEDLKVAILGAWTRITLYVLHKLVNCMHSRLISVLEKQGCHIDKF